MTEETADKLIELLSRFELVFDSDWEFTTGRILDENFVANDGTFIEPKVDDEENNWANRARLLDAYREAISAVEAEGIYCSQRTGSPGVAHPNAADEAELR
jgi:hypothetical protein